MINLNLTIQELEAVLKHIEQSAVGLIDKIRGQAAPQVQAVQAAQVVAPAVSATQTSDSTQTTTTDTPAAQ